MTSFAICFQREKSSKGFDVERVGEYLLSVRKIVERVDKYLLNVYNYVEQIGEYLLSICQSQKGLVSIC